MPIFEYTTVLAFPPSVVFDFLAPPSPIVALVSGPDRLRLGSGLAVCASKFGEGAGFTDEQVSGPFQEWSHPHVLTSLGDGTSMTDRVEFEGPSGWLGWFLTNARIMQGLAAAFVFREWRF